MLRDDINKALNEAMKAKNERAVSTLRMVNSSLKNADIEARGAGKPPLGDAEVLGLLQKMIKQRQESVELYQKGGRADLVKQEQEEIAIISAYLPKQMSDAEVKAGDRGRDQGNRRRRHEGHGQGDRRAARQICRPDGFRQGERDGEGEADVVRSTRRHARPCAGASTSSACKVKTWMAGTSPAMTVLTSALRTKNDRGRR